MRSAWDSAIDDAVKPLPIDVPARSPMPSRIWEFALSHGWVRMVAPGRWVWDLDAIGARS